MSIKVRVFASLSEQTGVRDTTCEFRPGMTIRQVWETVARDARLPPNSLSAVNFEYADFDATVSDGDEVGFFPPVTGG